MKPELIKFVAGTKAKASEVNENFEKVLNYAETASAVVSFDIDTEYNFGQWVLGQVDDEFGFYESLVDRNKGHLLSDENYWKKVSMGGGGLEIGDIGFTQLAIDESLGKRRCLNGSVIIQDQYQIFTEKVKSSVAQNADLACTEEEWQNEVSATGFCGKYVVDDVAGTIRLPKYPEYLIAGLTNTAPVGGNEIALGLTNGTTNFVLASGSDGYVNSVGAVRFAESVYGEEVGEVPNASVAGNIGWKTWGVTSDPTKSGIIAHLDQAGNKIYGTYFIQVATGSSYQENITNEIELNNPFVLLEGQYFIAPVYNSSWLQSNESFTGSLALHPTAYNALLIEQNPNVEVGTTVDNYTKRGLSVKLDTEDYTDYDFVLNTTSQTFRCPLKLSGTSDEGLYLYFYVGETVQNANLVNVGRVEEKVASLIPDNSSVIASYAMPSDRYVDLTLGASDSTYTAPANGWFAVKKIAGSDFYFVSITNLNTGIEDFREAYRTSWCSPRIEVKKNDVVKVSYNAIGTTSYFRFYYAQGSESEA